jgi:hypothetical protein
MIDQLSGDVAYAVYILLSAAEHCSRVTVVSHSCGSLVKDARLRRAAAEATSAAVRAAKLPGRECLFHPVEREAIVANGMRYVGLSV